MGIDYKIESRKQELRFADPSDAYCKWAWRNIDWEPVLEFLTIRLELLAESSIHYWSECQVADMRNLIKDLVEGSEKLLWDEERRTEAAVLRPAAAELLAHFNHYVENEARIYVF